MKMIVRSFVFGPEKGGWKEGKENLTQQRIKGDAIIKVDTEG